MDGWRAAPDSGVIKGFYDAAAQDKKNVSLSQRNKSRIYYLRNLNNWIKGTLISRHIDLVHDKKRDSGINILDFCCGKGGDQKKFQAGRVDHVTFVDISSASIDICRNRYGTLRPTGSRGRLYSADFIVHDCTTPLKLDKLYSIVNCQFALHYGFGTLEKARVMLQNGSRALEEGGFFIVTVPNAYEIIKRLKRSDDKRSFGNSVYKITFEESFTDSDQPPALFGARYHFHLDNVVNCPEYLVYPPLLISMAKEVGLECVDGPTPFADVLKSATMDKRSDGFDLLRIIDALESWFPAAKSPSKPDSSKDRSRTPPDRNPRRSNSGKGEPHHQRDRSRSPINRKEDEANRTLVAADEPGAYKHVEDKRDSLRPPVGTISLPEWEAFCIYCVFVFKKPTSANKV
ncbi:hypothetical protein Aperf_G00000008256 [Anoplocephala perfoliata]